MLWQICLLLLGVYAMVSHWINRKFKNISDQMGSKIRRVPILEHAVNFFGTSTDRMNGLIRFGEETYNNEHGCVGLWLANKFLAIIGDPEAAEVVMKTCLEKDEMMNVTKQLIGNGSIFAPVSIWRPRRKILAPTFSQKTLNGFVKIFSKQSGILMEQLKTEEGKGDFSIFDVVVKYSMDSVCETALGIEVKSQSIPNHPVPASFNQCCNIASNRVTKPWFYPDSVFKWHWDFPDFKESCDVLKQFVAKAGEIGGELLEPGEILLYFGLSTAFLIKIIKSKRESMKEQNNNIPAQDKSDEEQETSKAKSFLEILIESGGEKGFNNLELQEEALVMLLAGTDTSSVAMSFTSLLLAKYPDIQEKVYRELKEVVQDNDCHIEAHHLPNLKYLEAVVKESLRLYPPVPLIVRKIDKDVPLPSGVTLIPGMGVVVHIWAIHRNPKFWGSDANVFRPERFLEGPLKHSYAFMPFSSGPRNCLGYQYAMMSIKTVMAHIVGKYRILPVLNPDEQISDNKEIPLKFEIMMKHKGNFKLQLQSRN